MKQAYSKPIVASIELVNDQAVLSACKTINVGGGQSIVYGGSINCEAGSNQCFVDGS